MSRRREESAHLERWWSGGLRTALCGRGGQHARATCRTRPDRTGSRTDPLPTPPRVRPLDDLLLRTGAEYRQRVASTPDDLSPAALEFLTARQLATLTTLRADGTPHVVPVGFTWDQQRHLARVITDGASLKARNAARGGPIVLCQFDGGRWLSLEGTSTVTDEPGAVAEGVARYAARYRQPRVNPTRVVIEVHVGRVLGSAAILRPAASVRPCARG